jgi:Protein of unknwon function (DUF3310)
MRYRAHGCERKACIYVSSEFVHLQCDYFDNPSAYRCTNLGSQRIQWFGGSRWFCEEHAAIFERVAAMHNVNNSGKPETSAVDHPAHYGGDNVYEAIKVIDAWQLGFALGNAVKYICRAGKKQNADDPLEDLLKARWYLDWEIQKREGKQKS